MSSATSRIRGFPLRTIEADSTLAAFTFGTASSLSFSVLQFSAGPLQNKPLTISYHAHEAIMLGKIRYIPESFTPGPSRQLFITFTFKLQSSTTSGGSAGPHITYPGLIQAFSSG